MLFTSLPCIDDPKVLPICSSEAKQAVLRGGYARQGGVESEGGSGCLSEKRGGVCCSEANVGCAGVKPLVSVVLALSDWLSLLLLLLAISSSLLLSILMLSPLSTISLSSLLLLLLFFSCDD